MTRVSVLAPASDASTPAVQSVFGAAALVLAGHDVILAELHRRRLAAVGVALERAGAEVRVVSDVAGLRRSAALLGPRAAVVIDAPLGGRSLTDSMTALRRQAAVLLVSPTATVGDRIALLRSGADHVLGAPEPQELVAALAAVLRRSDLRGRVRTPEVLTCGPLSVHLATRIGTCDGRVLTLTALEFDLLAYLISHAGDALRRDRLLADVWGYDIGGLETVTVHVRRLRRKIEVDPSRPVLLQTVWGVGYRLVDPSEDASTTIALPS